MSSVRSKKAPRRDSHGTKKASPAFRRVGASRRAGSAEVTGIDAWNDLSIRAWERGDARQETLYDLSAVKTKY